MKAQLYSFEPSIWASVPRLTLIEKGYHADDVEIKTVDLAKGENFSPAYLRINSKGTLPSLVVPLADTLSGEVDTKYRAITGTHDVIKFLDQSRSAQILDARGENGKANPAPVLGPATVEASAIADRLIELVHSQKADPNFLLLTARNREELEKQKSGFQGVFVKNRFDALNRYKAEAISSASSTENPRTQQQTAALVKWYDDKLAEETPLVKAYLQGDQTAIDALAAAGVVSWKYVGVVLADLETELGPKGNGGPFLLGGQISLVDLHVGAWLARVSHVAEGLSASGAKGLQALEEAVKWPGLGETSATVGPQTHAYWKALFERPSFQEVYKNGLH